ncbi:MAG: LPS assembly lipoprotein LptE [Succinivibrio sp.]
MKLKLALFALMMLGLSSCGFHIPNQNRLGSSIAEIDISGDYHSMFYKVLVQKLQARGIKVNYQGTANRENSVRSNIPSLSVTAPKVSMPLTSIDSRGAALEYNVIVTSSAVLTIPNLKRPIVMKNGLVRTTINKADNALASSNEQDIIISECINTLADQLIVRINYLGRQTDPDEPKSVPAELLLAKDENNSDIYIDKSQSMTLIEALKAQGNAESINAKSVSLSELNNGIKVLNSKGTHNLPKTEPKVVHQAPDSLSEEVFLKTAP